MTVRFQNCNLAGTLNLSLEKVGNYNNKWSHVAVTRTGGNQNLYINGNLEATQSDASENMRNPTTSFSEPSLFDCEAVHTGTFSSPAKFLSSSYISLSSCRSESY